MLLSSGGIRLWTKMDEAPPIGTYYNCKAKAGWIQANLNFALNAIPRTFVCNNAGFVLMGDFTQWFYNMCGYGQSWFESGSLSLSGEGNQNCCYHRSWLMSPHLCQLYQYYHCRLYMLEKSSMIIVPKERLMGGSGDCWWQWWSCR